MHKSPSDGLVLAGDRETELRIDLIGRHSVDERRRRLDCVEGGRCLGDLTLAIHINGVVLESFSPTVVNSH